MKNLTGQIERIVDVLGESQDKLEEIAFELLNDVDTVKNKNEEIYRLIDSIEDAQSENERKKIMQSLKNHMVEASGAMEILLKFVHINEQLSEQQRIYIEEARQIFDFLQFFTDTVNVEL